MSKKFEYMGVFFECCIFEKYGLGNYNETFKYLNELGFNTIILVDSYFEGYGKNGKYIMWKSQKSLTEGIPTAKKYFDLIMVHIGSGLYFYPQYFTDIGVKLSHHFYKHQSPIHEKGLIYYYDEPVIDAEDFSNIVKYMKDRNHKVSVTFGGSNYSYMKEVLDTGVEIDYHIIDVYPVLLRSSDAETERKILEMESEIKWVRKLLSKKKMFFLMQMWAAPNSARYPSIEQTKKMLDICLDNNVDGVIFFLWNSGWTGMESLSGMDILPYEYHKLASIYAPKKP